MCEKKERQREGLGRRGKGGFNMNIPPKPVTLLHSVFVVKKSKRHPRYSLLGKKEIVVELYSFIYSTNVY